MRAGPEIGPAESQSTGFWNTQESGEAGTKACAAGEPEMLSHSDTVLFLFVVSRPMPLLVLLKTRERQQPLKQEGDGERDHGLLGDHLKAGRGYLPGCRSSAWGHAAGRYSITHPTGILPGYRLPVCVIPLATVILHRWLGPIRFRARSLTPNSAVRKRCCRLKGQVRGGRGERGEEREIRLSVSLRKSFLEEQRSIIRRQH